MISPLQAWYLLRRLGPRVLALQARIKLREAMGILQRQFPPRAWESIDLDRIARPGTPAAANEYAAYKREHTPEFLFPLGRPPAIPAGLSNGPRRPDLSARFRLLEQNRCLTFFRADGEVEPDWFSEKAHCAPPWFELSTVDPVRGDIRAAWEPARAAWAMDLARARPAGLAVDSAGQFFRWLDAWMAACPPHVGIHWLCGQESSIRFLALALAFWSLADDAQTAPRRWLQMARLAWATGYRVYRHIDYAVSQKNNHALSEACGLLLVSQLFPELRESAEWRRCGRRVLERELRRQIYADGSYIQHSMNYQRVMLDVSLVGLRLAELSGRPLPADIYQRLGRCGEFIFEMMEPGSGQLPNYGPDDGSDVLPLTECVPGDYRPVVQAVYYLVHRRRLLPPGPWDELSLWLFGAESLAAEQLPPRGPVSSAFEAGGYYTLRQPQSWAMIRCHGYRDRMPQCDPLHVDLWWRGRNVLHDCGTYQYYVPGRPDVEHYFKSIRAHNTVEVGGCDPAAAVSRFLWVPWIQARRRHYSAPVGGPLVFEGEHYGYDRRPWHVLHRRTVIGLPRDLWVVVDDLYGPRHPMSTAVLRWHLPDVPWHLHGDTGPVSIDTAEGPLSLMTVPKGNGSFESEVVRGRDRPGEVEGLVSPRYSEYLPSPVLKLTAMWQGGFRIITAIAPEWVQLAPVFGPRDQDRWQVDAHGGGVTLSFTALSRSSRRVFLSVDAV